MYLNYFFESMKKIVMIVFVGLLVPAGLQAQKVYIEDVQGNGKVILDLTVETGMPAGAITNEPKTWAGKGSPANSGSYLADNLETGDINKKVFEKLEIAPSDLGQRDWAAAFNDCRDPLYNGGGWRLPTQRELLLMWIFREALNTALTRLTPSGTGAVLLSANYRSATENTASYAWFVHFGSGNTNFDSKTTDTYRVRCVREVTN
jgi:hypothetical protein